MTYDRNADALARTSTRTVKRPPPTPRNPRNISPKMRAFVLERDGFKCRRCGAGPNDARLVVDHVVPVAKGGTAEPKNLQVLCDPCNAGKGAAEPHAHDLHGPPPPRTQPRVVSEQAREAHGLSRFQPQPDGCRACRDAWTSARAGESYPPSVLTPHYALQVVGSDAQGYRALYRCERGHEWTTFWAWGSEIQWPERAPLPGRSDHFDGIMPVQAGCRSPIFGRRA